MLQRCRAPLLTSPSAGAEPEPEPARGSPPPAGGPAPGCRRRPLRWSRAPPVPLLPPRAEEGRARRAPHSVRPPARPLQGPPSPPRPAPSLGAAGARERSQRGLSPRKTGRAAAAGGVLRAGSTCAPAEPPPAAHRPRDSPGTGGRQLPAPAEGLQLLRARGSPRSARSGGPAEAC